jgi:hypothetical protein
VVAGSNAGDFKVMTSSAKILGSRLPSPFADQFASKQLGRRHVRISNFHARVPGSLAVVMRQPRYVEFGQAPGRQGMEGQ